MEKDNLIFKVRENEDNIKIKEYLKEFAKFSGRLIRGAARDGRIVVNGNKVKLSYKVKKGDIIEFDIHKNESQNIQPEKMKIDIVYEDKDVIVVNKQPGIVVHPTKRHPLGTLANGLLYYFKESGQNCIVRLVSRLDMNTSGLIIIAKNQFAHMCLSRNIGSDNFKKSYLAIVHGNFKKQKGTINLPISRAQESIIERVVDEKGQRSITHFTVKDRFTHGDLVEFILETGRTHQIRVHSTYLGHPLYGDSLYGIKEDEKYINRQALHAYKIKFPHPRTGKIIELEKELPKDMKLLIERLKKL